MQLLITGTPGTGKTTVSKQLAAKLGYAYLNEMDFSVKNQIGAWDTTENELVVPLDKLETALEKELKKQKKTVLEGHLLCEITLPVDLVIVLTVNPELLETRLETKQYKAEKLMDNLFCEGIEYCKKHAERNYSKARVVAIKNEKDINETLSNIMELLQERGLLDAK
jgi:adenylate kinase